MDLALYVFPAVILKSLSMLTEIFNRMISYPNYKFIFPIKALGMFARHYGDLELL